MSEGAAMDLDDFGGAAAGALGGLLKFYQDPTRAVGWKEITTSLLTSVLGGLICGFGVQAVIQWQWPSIPYNVILAAASVSGVASAILTQSAVGLVSLLIGRARLWIDYKFPPPPSRDGTIATGPVQQPKV